MIQIQDLLTTARQLEIDTDHLVRQTDKLTQLLLRLGEGVEYPDELHTHASETILVLEGECHLMLKEDSLVLKQGQQFTIEANLLHKFLPESEACLSIIFEKQD
ncbi:cupin domain-containing protein [Marinomonas sp. PE14-40]|uniref:cupin domain-containing protein n=1 Tax=Marinomonas sp. PE14-40 TaxID=3060621 RepID=UPI003F664FC2